MNLKLKLHTLLNYWDHEHNEEDEFETITEATEAMGKIITRELAANSFVFTVVPIYTPD